MTSIADAHEHGLGHDHGHHHADAVMSARSLLTRLRTLMPLLGEHRRLIGVAYLSGVVHQLLMLASAGIGAYVVALAAQGASRDQLGGWLIALGCLILPLVAMNVADSTFAHVAAFRALADTRAKVFAAFERLSPGYMLERRSGDVGSAAVSDVEQIELFFAHTLSPLAVASTVPIATTVALGWFHWSLACVLIPVLLLLASVLQLLEQPFEQLDLFTTQQEQHAREQEAAALERERRLQQAVLGIRSRFGKNAILKGMNLEDGATTAERNRQIGGHKA